MYAILNHMGWWHIGWRRGKEIETINRGRRKHRQTFKIQIYRTDWKVEVRAHYVAVA